MGTEVQTGQGFISFDYKDQQVRVTGTKENPLWVLVDVCKVLDISHIKDTADRLDKDEVGQTEVIDSMGRKQKAWAVTESGLYAVILRSDKPEAKPFRKWITSEVLPSIRKYGAYVTEDTLDNILDNPDFGIKLLTELKNEREEKQRLQEQLETQKPLVEFAATVQGTDSNILVRETSKLASNYIGVDIGEKGLYQKLRDWGLVCRKKNEPTKKAYNQKLLEYVERPIRQRPYVGKTTMVTPKGQKYIISRLIKESVERTVA
ncbi:MAG TPA: phage antirepressor Ant [Clostridiaceae bacterium]|nr:phage antirepressor Ant [Clostridiaceae bacterium]